LPITDQPEVISAAAACVTQPGTERVLFVDNEPMLAEVAARSLRKLGYRVEACMSATHAVTLLRETPAAFDIVISDLDMPQLTGLDLLRQVRVLRPDLPTILCTGSRYRVPQDPELARTVDAIGESRARSPS
jgi:CheY-like chemotaxis protein